MIAAACLALAAGTVLHQQGVGPSVLFESVGPAVRLIRAPDATAHESDRSHAQQETSAKTSSASSRPRPAVSRRPRPRSRSPWSRRGRRLAAGRSSGGRGAGSGGARSAPARPLGRTPQASATEPAAVPNGAPLRPWPPRRPGVSRAHAAHEAHAAHTSRTAHKAREVHKPTRRTRCTGITRRPAATGRTGPTRLTGVTGARTHEAHGTHKAHAQRLTGDPQGARPTRRTRPTRRMSRTTTTGRTWPTRRIGRTKRAGRTTEGAAAGEPGGWDPRVTAPTRPRTAGCSFRLPRPSTPASTPRSSRRPSSARPCISPARAARRFSSPGRSARRAGGARAQRPDARQLRGPARGLRVRPGAGDRRDRHRGARGGVRAADSPRRRDAWRAVMVTALQSHRTTYGALALFFPDARRFGDEDVAALRTFAIHAAIALDNRKLMQEKERIRRTRRSHRRLQPGLSGDRHRAGGQGRTAQRRAGERAVHRRRRHEGRQRHASATRPATPCSWSWRGCCATAAGSRTSSRGTAATSSSSSCPAPARTAPRRWSAKWPRRSQQRNQAGREPRLSASAGTHTATADGVDMLLREADRRMYASKRSRRRPLRGGSAAGETRAPEHRSTFPASG